MTVELLIQHGDKILSPAVEEGIVWSTERKNAPGTLNFTVIKDKLLDITEGDAVRMRVDGKNVFYGFIFKKSCDKEEKIKVTAYDQLRYLKNKDTYVYTNKTASEVIKMIAADFKLNVGVIEDTGFKIASRVESNSSLFDIIENALDITLQNKGGMYVLYDDFGRLTLKSIGSMRTDILIDEETGENFDYTSSIDDNTYDRVKITYDNDETGRRDVYIAQSGENIGRWGVLQYCDTLKKGENGQAKADALLNLYNAKTRSLSITNAFGDVRVRAGSMVVVMLDLGDVRLKNLMLVEKCRHEFKETGHFMNLTLRGGEFNA